MEIPEINMMSNFEAGVNCLQHPSLVSRFFALPGFEVYSFWKWGALIFAILATFSGIIRRVKLVLFRFIPSPNLIQQIVISEDDDISLASSSDDEREEMEEGEEEECRPTTSFSSQRRLDDEDSFRVRNRRRGICGGGGDGFDWSDFTSGKNVVKLWDSLSSSFNFGLDFDDLESDDVVSTWDFDRRQDSNEFPCRVSNIPADVVFMAEGNEKGDGVVLRGYDTRVRSRVPDLYAEWRSSPAAKSASLVSSTAVIGGKIYVRDDVSGVLTVGDVRNVRMPLENTGDSDGETWWDADAVIIDQDEYVVVDKST